MRNILIAVIVTVVLCILSTLLISCQLYYSARSEALSHARNALLRTEGMLDEASQATREARYLLSGRCTPAALRNLNRLAAVLPHLRSVNLLNDNSVWCSSLLGDQFLTFTREKFLLTTLALYTGDEVTPGIPLLVYQTSFPEGRVAVSIGDVYLREVLSTQTVLPSLVLNVGNQWMTWQGLVSPVSPKMADPVTIVSTLYPFRIVWPGVPFFSVQRLWQQGAWVMLMLALLSLAAGGLLWRYLGKYTTPAENLAKALRRGEIFPFYQPVVDGTSGRICGVEVLARWKHPQAGFIPPDVFIPLAEKSGLIIPLTRHLMTTVQADLLPIADRLPQGLHVAFNISAAHSASPSLMADCQTFMSVYENTHSVRLVLEITEREQMALTSECCEMLGALQSEGVTLALDDFGTGYSNLSYLNTLTVDFIKIDRSFVGRISPDPTSTRLIDCVIEMAQKLSVSIVAEGVETQYQADYLVQKGVDMQQGYFYWRPVSVSDLIKILVLRKSHRDPDKYASVQTGQEKLLPDINSWR